MSRQRTQEEEDEALAQRLQLQEMMQGAGIRHGSRGHRNLLSSSLRPPQRSPQVVEVVCPQCQTRNQFQMPYTSDPVTVRCGSCSENFQVQVPPPPAMDVRLCRRCGNMNQYALPDIGSPFPNVQCGVCGHVSQRRGQVSERDRRQAEMLEASTDGGPSVMVNIGGRRQQVPLLFLMALMSQEGRQSNAAGSADIAALPVQRVCEATHLGEQTTCRICMDDYKDGEDLKTLPCLHIFHCACIDSWLQRDNSCPICKTPIGEDSSNSRHPPAGG